MLEPTYYETDYSSNGIYVRDTDSIGATKDVACRNDKVIILIRVIVRIKKHSLQYTSIAWLSRLALCRDKCEQWLDNSCAV